MYIHSFIYLFIFVRITLRIFKASFQQVKLSYNEFHDSISHVEIFIGITSAQMIKIFSRRQQPDRLQKNTAKFGRTVGSSLRNSSG